MKTAQTVQELDANLKMVITYFFTILPEQTRHQSGSKMHCNKDRAQIAAEC